MTSRLILPSILLAVVPVPLLASDLGTIQKYLRAHTPVFDEKGTEIDRVDSKKLPKGAKVLSLAGNGNLEIIWQGKRTFIRPADVTYDGVPPCLPSIEPQRPGARSAAAEVPGMRAGAGSSGKACIPVNR